MNKRTYRDLDNYNENAILSSYDKVYISEHSKEHESHQYFDQHRNDVPDKDKKIEMDVENPPVHFPVGPAKVIYNFDPNEPDEIPLVLGYFC